MAAPDDKGLRRARSILLGAFGWVVPALPAMLLVGAETAYSVYGIGPDALWRYIAAAVLSALLGVGLLGLGAVRFGRLPQPGTRIYYASYALLVASYLLAAPYGPRDPQFTTGALLGAWWAAAALSLPRRRLQAALLAAPLPLVSVALAPVTADGAWGGMALQAGFVYWAALICGAFFYAVNAGLVRLWELFEEVIEGREMRARLAASEERLRIARDMHDILGHSLSGIAVKSQLAARLVDRDAGAAKREMRTVQTTAREALGEVRAAVAGYREADLAAEARSVCDVLRAAGAECSVDIPEGVPARLTAPVSWVVREAGTNAIRHSSARRFSVSVRSGDGALVVEVANDGATDAPARAAGDGDGHGGAAGDDGGDGGVGSVGGAVGGGGDGSGLAGMRERVAEAGGVLSAGPDGVGGYLVRAEFPMEGAREAEGNREGGAA